ncbi:hypothetical protein I862_02230 [endosymbiont of Acanthamoeba sp. UWC8]|uniref:hypothetical protein n=1 Tax=endosymbiont of Acanthamoeba sp. UWC8 TaxID=86106 RepID=UPI0004D138A5|nr:hypothetical protein [endosymbiont of Acanthamoeba sp. UWC8]AIF81009.1 hypothetical protein I862_02230 [endosymbiont of Acanthamoeba sp. UWC8]
MRLFNFILKAAYPYRIYLAGMLLTMAGTALHINLRNYLTKLLINAVVGSQNNEVIYIAFTYCVLQVFIVLVWVVYDFCAIKNIPLTSDITNLMIAKIEKYDITFFKIISAAAFRLKLKIPPPLFPILSIL